MTWSTDRLALAKIVLANPSLLRVRPDVSLFMARYMRRFRIKRSGRSLILHSPPAAADQRGLLALRLTPPSGRGRRALSRPGRPD